MPLAQARALVLQYGWNATAYQILNPGLQLWFSRAQDAVIGYVDWGGMRVTAGGPICAPHRLAEIVKEFESDTAAINGTGICYFGAGSRLENLLSILPGYSLVLLGAQPVWHPKAWEGIISTHPSLRAQVHRARNKSVSVREWPVEAAAASPDIRRCLKEWLAQRPLPSMHFLVEPQTLDRLWDRRIFVAERNGIPIGFLVATPVPVRNGWLIEQIVRGRAAPNGTAEILVDAAFQAAQAEGREYFTLGLSPLSHAVPKKIVHPWWLDLVFQWLSAHGGRFYNFRGLESFKSKFAPEVWEPIFAICNRPKLTPRAILAIAAAFGGISPFAFVALALGKALRQEVAWLFRAFFWNPKGRKKVQNPN